MTRSKFLVGLLGSTLLAPVVAHAQASQGPEITEVIVTAQRRSERLQDVPVAVSVTTGATLERQAIHSLADLSARQPDLRVVGGTSADQLHIRGTGSGFNGGFEQSVGTFVDGVYRSRARASRVSLFDIDRVEVLKGPQTTFFGANAIAGALNITTRRPGESFAANASALYSPSDGERNFEAGVSAPVSSTLAVRIAARWSGMDGYSKSPRDVDGPDLNDKQGRISAVWRPAEAVEVFARFDKARMRDKGLFNYEVVGCPPRVNVPANGNCLAALTNFGPVEDTLNGRSQGALSGRFALDMEESVVAARVDLGGAELISTTAYLEQTATTVSDTGNLPGVTSIGTGTRTPSQPMENFKQFSQELRLQSSWDHPLQYMAGVYYERGDLATSNYIGVFTAPLGALVPGVYTATTPIVQNYRMYQISHTFSGFGSLSYKLSDALSVTGSLRYSRIRKTASRSVTMGTGSGFYPGPDDYVPGPAAAQAILLAATRTNPANFANPRRVDRKWMPSVNVKYNLSSDVMTYASFSKGFKAGGYSFVGTDVFDPEYVNAYELGLKARWLDRRVMTNIAAFRSDYRDLQEAQNIQTIAGSVLTISNAAQSRAQGIEFETQVQVTDEVSLFGNVAYLRSKYRNFTNASCNPLQLAIQPVGCVQNLSGHVRPYAPDWSGSAGIDYTRPVADNLKLNANALVYFTGKYFNQSAMGDMVLQRGFAKVDARVGLGTLDGKWEGAIIAKNIFDKTTAAFMNYASGSAGSSAVIIDRPRSIAFQVNYRFN